MNGYLFRHVREAAERNRSEVDSGDGGGDEQSAVMEFTSHFSSAIGLESEEGLDSYARRY